MRRDFSRLKDGPFDLLVIGGGVYGAWTAYDAALRGLRVALVEQRDWAQATSSASSKLIHGGLRYLEHGRLGLVRRSLDERSRLRRLGPHRVTPLRFVLPVYAGDRVGRFRLRIGLWIYDRLAGKKRIVDPYESIDRVELLTRYGLRADGLRGGFRFGDCQTDDARFVVEIVDGAVEAGAAAVNYARASGLLMDGPRVVGATVVDEETGERAEVRSEMTACCAGAWSEELIGPQEPRKPIRARRTKGVHLVLPPLPTDDGFVLAGRDRRIVFLIPWYGRTLLGTTDTDFFGDPARVEVEAQDVDYLLACANRVLSGKPWTRGDVIAGFAGIRTLAAAPGSRSPSAVTREWRLHEPLDRLVVPVGGKYTSARADAAHLVDRVLSRLGRARVRCPTRDRGLPWRPEGDPDARGIELVRTGLALGIDEETIGFCSLRYGSRIERIFQRVRECPELGRRVSAELPFCMAEIVHAVEDEMARTLEDVLRRRVPLALLCRMPERVLGDLAGRVGILLGWSESRQRHEVASLLIIDAVAATSDRTA